MSALILIYELNGEFGNNFDYSTFYKIRDSYQCIKISESSYALKTSEKPSKIRHKLQESLHPDDNLYVITLKKPYSSRGLKKIVDWLDANLHE